MRLLFAGTPQAAVPSLTALIASPHEIVAVLTRADAPAGRGRKLTPSPVRVAAEEAGIPVITDAPRTPCFSDRLRDLDLDACAVVAYGHILRPDVLAVPRTGWVNLHFSLLPAWRGAAPVQRAIMAGDTITGATTFLLDEGMDTGPTLGMMTETIRPTDTSGDLLNRLALAGSHLLVATMDGIEAGQLSPAAQPADGISLAPKLTSDDAFLNWSWPALRVSRVARACTPEPGPWTLLSTPGEEAARLRITVGPIRPDITDLAPGQLRPGKRELLVGTGTHAIALDTVHPAGKRPMQAADWARGAHLTSQSTLAITSPQEASQ